MDSVASEERDEDMGDLGGGKDILKYGLLLFICYCEYEF